MLVGGVVVDHQVQIEVGRRALVDDAEEADELLVAVPLGAMSDDGARLHVEGGEQRRGTVPLVVVRHGASSALLQRQTRLGAVERLDWLFSSTASTSARSGGSR